VKNIKGTCRFTPYRKLYQQRLIYIQKDAVR